MATQSTSRARDLAALRLPDSRTELCKNSSIDVVAEDVERLLTTQVEGILRKTDEDGSQHNLRVFIKSVTNRTVIIESATDEALEQGASGSALFSGENRLGMLVRVNGNDGVALRADYVDAFWTQVRPKAASCEGGCDAKLSDLEIVQTYRTSTALSGHITIVHYDTVFRLPEEWPFPPYFHVMKDESTIEVEGLTPTVRLSFAFSFSNDSNERSGDILVDGSLIPIAGEASTIFGRNGKAWSATVTASGGIEPTQFRLRVK
jgi:hypothetical protein